MGRTARWMAAAVVFVTGAVAFAAKDCYVVTRSGQRVPGTNLTSDEQGNLQMQLEEGGPVQTFKPGTYRYGYVPKPREVQLLEEALKANKHEIVADKAGDIFEKYKLLGWGGYIAYLKGTAQTALKKPADALATFELGQRFCLGHDVELQKGRVDAYLALGKKEEALTELQKLAKAEDPGAAAYSFNARGRMLADQGRKQDAVLQYMKTLLLFEPNEVRGERDEARKQIVALLKELGDGRYKDIENFK